MTQWGDRWCMLYTADTNQDLFFSMKKNSAPRGEEDIGSSLVLRTLQCSVPWLLSQGVTSCTANWEDLTEVMVQHPRKVGGADGVHGVAELTLGGYGGESRDNTELLESSKLGLPRIRLALNGSPR